MKDNSATETLVMALPVLLVLLALIGAIIFFPEGSNLDIRSKAAPVVATPTMVAVPTSTTKEPEYACTELYNPVCATISNKTYDNECEARLAKDLPVKTGACK